MRLHCELCFIVPSNWESLISLYLGQNYYVEGSKNNFWSWFWIKKSHSLRTFLLITYTSFFLILFAGVTLAIRTLLHKALEVCSTWESSRLQASPETFLRYSTKSLFSLTFFFDVKYENARNLWASQRKLMG